MWETVASPARLHVVLPNYQMFECVTMIGLKALYLRECFKDLRAPARLHVAVHHRYHSVFGARATERL